MTVTQYDYEITIDFANRDNRNTSISHEVMNHKNNKRTMNGKILQKA